MSELPLIAVTDSATCPRPLPEQIERLAKLTELRPQAVILRAKSLDKAAYRTLALQAQQSCEAAGIALILHSDWQLARELGISMLHLPLALLRQISECSSPGTSTLRSARQALLHAVLAFCRLSAAL